MNANPKVNLCTHVIGTKNIYTHQTFYKTLNYVKRTWGKLFS